MLGFVALISIASIMGCSNYGDRAVNDPAVVSPTVSDDMNITTNNGNVNPD